MLISTYLVNVLRMSPSVLPRCGHCKKLAPEYESAAKILAEHTPPVPLAMVDATEETQLANRFAIDGYPTLKVFHNGLAYDYEGPRSANGEALPCSHTPFMCCHGYRYC